MARRRLQLAAILVAVLSVMPPGIEQSGAQVNGAIVLGTTGVVGTAVGSPTQLEHIRFEFAFTGLQMHLTASRQIRTVDCRVSTGPAGILLRARETHVEGRGFADALVNAARGDGALVAADAVVENVHCEMSFLPGGRFHRIGSALVGRLPIEVRATARSGQLVFEHSYCAHLVGTWVPIFPAFQDALVTLSATGDVGSCPPDEIPGRTVTDNNEHG